VFDFALYSSAQKIYTQNNNKIKPNSADTKKIRKVKKKAYAKIVDFFHPLPPSVHFAHFGKWFTIMDDPLNKFKKTCVFFL